MANTKISNLPAAASLTGSDLMPVVQSGVTKKGTFDQIPFLQAGTGAVARTAQAKMRDVVSVLDFGADPTGATDSTAAIQAAINNSSAVYIPYGVYRITSTLKTRTGTVLTGDGDGTAIKADGVSGPAILTYSGSGNSTAPNQLLSGFCVVGTATCAVAFAHCTVSRFERLALSSSAHSLGFSGTDGFVFEYFWGSVFEGMYTNGASITGVPFKWNKVVLNSEFSLLYTSNLTDYLFYFDAAVQQYSTGTGVGNGKIAIRTPTAQGSNKYAFVFRGYAGVVVDNLYSENNLGILDAQSGSDIVFINSDFQGIRSATSTHDIWLDQTGSGSSISGITFENCRFSNLTKKIIGAVAARVVANYPRCTSNVSFFGLVERNSNTTSAMALTVTEQQTAESYLYLKTSNFGWKFGKMSLTETAGVPTWSATTVVPPLTSVTKY